MVEILFAKKTDFDTHAARTDDPHSVTKSQVGLGNVVDVDLGNVLNVAQVEDAGATPSIQAALAAARPAAATAGRIFIATDTLEISRDNGATWDDLVGADLVAVEALSSNGLLSRTGDGAFSTRALAAPAKGFTITNPDGVSGNPTFVLADDLAAVEGLSGTGGVERTGADAWATFALTAFAKTILDDADAGAVKTTLGLVIGTDVQADLDVPDQAEAEAGTATTERVWTAERIQQAIVALESTGLPAPDFTSSEQTVAVDTLLEVAHSLSSIPILVQVVLRCKNTDLGYSVGDEVPLYGPSVTVAAADFGVTISSDTTNVTIVQGQGINLIVQSTFNGGTIDVSKWKWIVRAWK